MGMRSKTGTLEATQYMSEKGTQDAQDEPCARITAGPHPPLLACNG